MPAGTTTGDGQGHAEIDLCRILHPSSWLARLVPAGPDEPAPEGDDTVERHLAEVIRIEDVPAFLAARGRR